jgi:hypothetical protein
VTETVVVSPSKRQRHDTNRNRDYLHDGHLAGDHDSFGGGTIADFIRAKQERERHEKKK